MKTALELTDLYRNRGLKLTPQRQCVFALLESNATHPTADSLFDAARESMPTISQKTVYTILHELSELGELKALNVGTGALRFDPNTGQHNHLVCKSCARVVDVGGVDAAGIRLSEIDRHGFEVDETEVIFRGLCGECRRKAP